MELQNLGYFLALFEERHFGQAAKRCGIAQPSMTNAIKRLEQQIGGNLFVRKPKIQPTVLALTLKPYAEEILRALRRAEQAVNQILRNKRYIAEHLDQQRTAYRQNPQPDFSDAEFHAAEDFLSDIRKGCDKTGKTRADV